MKDRRPKKIKEAAQLILFLVFFVLTVALNLQCAEDDNPAGGPECGSGRVTWNAKAQRCYDQADNKIVPNSCCGR